METAQSIRRKKLSRELSVGLLALLALALMGLFGWLMGAWRPFATEVRYQLLYGFAGGVEVGSPVRVSGVKVGRVESIQFLPPGEVEGVSLALTIAVAAKAAPSIREDSKFYINMAGIIGERYVEISPGSGSAAVLKAGSRTRGEDPPRIDQLLSQGYGVFGKVQEFLESNEKVITEFLSQAKGLLDDANKMLKQTDRRKLFALLDNLVVITNDMKGFTSSLKDEKSRRFFDQLIDVMARVHGVDKAALKKFLQEEGVRARIF
jgi:phospholipid/cholesterol/gamma-HCH transport system substrate-binding protein